MLAICFLIICACFVFQQLQLLRIRRYMREVSDAALSFLEDQPDE